MAPRDDCGDLNMLLTPNRTGRAGSSQLRCHQDEEGDVFGAASLPSSSPSPLETVLLCPDLPFPQHCDKINSRQRKSGRFAEISNH